MSVIQYELGSRKYKIISGDYWLDFCCKKQVGDFETDECKKKTYTFCEAWNNADKAMLELSGVFSSYFKNLDDDLSSKASGQDCYYNNDDDDDDDEA